MYKIITILLVCLMHICTGQVHPYYPGEYNNSVKQGGTIYQLGGKANSISGLTTHMAGGAGGAHHQVWFDSLSQGGNVYTMGDNQYGELGVGNTTDNYSSAQKILTDSLGNTFNNVIKVQGGAGVNTTTFGWNSAALKADGTVWVWGSTIGGIRGNGTDGNAINTRPVQVPFPGGTVIVDIAISQVALALDNAGNVWTWGGHNNTFGNQYCLGQGNSPNYNSPTKITLPGIGTAKAISGGEWWELIQLTDGKMYGLCPWTGYLGIGPNNNTLPYQSPGMPGNATPVLLDTAWNLPAAVSSFAVNNSGIYLILTDGTLWYMGGNEHGGAGQGTQINWSTYSSPWNWDQGRGEFQQRKPVQIAIGKSNFAYIFTSVALTYYALFEDTYGITYALGRGKPGTYGGIIPDLVQACDQNIGGVNGAYPDWRNVIWLTPVNPFQASVFTSTCPGCLTGQLTGSPCSNSGCSGLTSTPSGAYSATVINGNTIVLSLAAATSTAHVWQYLHTQTSGPSVQMGVQAGVTDTIYNAPAGNYTFSGKITDVNLGTATVSASVQVGSYISIPSGARIIPH